MKAALLIALIAAMLMAVYAIDLDPNIIGRRWYVGGKFDSAKNKDGSSATVSNLAYWDGATWQALTPIGPNGPVYTIKMDTKFNLIIGGGFTTVNNVATGPVARFNGKDGVWEKIVGDATFSPGSVVAAIATDCFPQTTEGAKNILTGTRCDVYFGGQFNLTGTGVNAKNVARWAQTSNTEGKLYDLGDHGITGTVFTLYKKSLVTLTGDSDKYLWIGGDLKPAGAGPKYWGRFEDIFNGNNAKLVNLDGQITGPVRNIRYVNKYLLGQTDRIFITGSFSVADVPACKVVCEYNHKDKKFVAVSNADKFVGEGHDIALNGEDVYVAGNFTVEGISNVARLQNGKTAWDGVHTTQGVNFNFIAHTIDVCSLVSNACTSGSVAVANREGQIKFFNNNNAVFENFGDQTSPLNVTANTGSVFVGSVYSYAGAGSLQITFAVLAIVAAIVMMF